MLHNGACHLMAIDIMLHNGACHLMAIDIMLHNGACHLMAIDIMYCYPVQIIATDRSLGNGHQNEIPFQSLIIFWVFSITAHFVRSFLICRSH